ncbi:MAG: hypothetical protein ACRD0O_00745 [Acidimicrobiia bacterium]
MKRFVGLLVATTALVLPTIPAGAASATPVLPADYAAYCEQGYQAIKPVWDGLFASPAGAVFSALEPSVCGEKKYTP